MFKIALKNFLKTKNIIIIFISFCLALIIRLLLFKYLEVNVFIESDYLFCISRFTGESIC